MNISRALRLPIVCGLLLSTAGGCGRGTEEPTLVPCAGNLAIAVSSGTTPSFTWTPQCGANRLEVFELNDVVGTTVTGWEVSSASGLFASPVRYGAAPEGADAGVAPAPLKSGTTYRVDVFRVGGEDIILGSGSTIFTP